MFSSVCTGDETLRSLQAYSLWKTEEEEEEEKEEEDEEEEEEEDDDDDDVKRWGLHRVPKK